MKDKFGESIFVKCDCCCNLLEINYDEEFKRFNIAVWVNHPGTRPLSKKERIRWCEHVMKTGKPWADHTIVTPEDAKWIAKFVSKHTTPPKHGKTKKD